MMKTMLATATLYLLLGAVPALHAQTKQALPEYDLSGGPLIAHFDADGIQVLLIHSDDGTKSYLERLKK
jgi:hypothetical protein